MLTAVRQALPAIATWGIASGVASFCILGSDSSTSLLDAALSARTWTAVLIGALVATSLSPLMRSPRLPWWAWAIIGLPMGFLIMFLYFSFSPQGWQTEIESAWLWSLLFFFDLHPWITIPASLIAGGLGSHLIHRNSVQSG